MTSWSLESVGNTSPTPLVVVLVRFGFHLFIDSDFIRFSLELLIDFFFALLRFKRCYLLFLFDKLLLRRKFVLINNTKKQAKSGTFYVPLHLLYELLLYEITHGLFIKSPSKNLCIVSIILLLKYYIFILYVIRINLILLLDCGRCKSQVPSEECS